MPSGYPSEYKEAFMEAINIASDKMPDVPVLILASAAMPSNDDETDYPCAIGGRNLNSLEGEPEDLIAPVIRSTFELCLELCHNDKAEARDMFTRSMERAFSLNISGTTVERINLADEEKEAESDEAVLREAFLRKIRGKDS